MSESAMQDRIDEITRRYEPQLAALEQKGKALADDVGNPNAGEAVLGGDVDISWKKQEFIFDLPSVTMKDRKIGLDVPEVTFTKHRVVFSVPEVRMVAKKIGQYPQFHGVKVKWKDIITHMPETVMVRKEISTDIPRVMMKRRDITLPIPEFTMRRHRLVCELPQFTVKNLRAEATKVKEAGEALQTEAEKLAAAMQAEVEAVLGSFGGGFAAGAFNAGADVAKAYDASITQIQTTIASLQAQGCDPIKVPTDAGDLNLRKLLDDVVTQKAQAVAALGEVAADAKEELAGVA